jgi:hypothetical protein
MKTDLFESFAERIDSLSEKRILTAIEMEHVLMEEDLLRKNISPAEIDDADSILHFCQFIKAVAEEDNILPVVAPMDHILFYRKILMRLIKTHQLPESIQRKFDLTFSASFSKSLAC